MLNSIKVLVVDDSAFMRKIIREILEEDSSIHVVGTARNGQDALAKIEELDPDIVTMDIEMPQMDGITALKLIMRETPRAVIMLSSLTEEGAEVTIRALQLGAVDFITKPTNASSYNLGVIKKELAVKVKGAASAILRNLRVIKPQVPEKIEPKIELPALNKRKKLGFRLGRAVAIGVSTGGPKTLLDIIPRLPADFPATIFITQHMPAGFTKSLAERMDSLSKIRVEEARDTEIAEQGTAYLAPGDFHMTVSPAVLAKGVMVKVDEKPLNTLHRPSVDVMMSSVAATYGAKSVGVILTGMGQDGTKGMSLIKGQGGKTLAEDESSCIVFGMPKMAIESGCIDKVVSSRRMAAAIMEAVSWP